MERWYRILYCIIYPFFNLVHPSKAIGKENLPEGGALICANHTKASDPFFIVFAFGLKNRVCAMAKAELLRIPVIGPLIGKAGVFGIERGKADVGAIKTAMKLLKSGEKMVMFPEGTRRAEDSENHEAKTGAAMLALRTGVPIVPVYIPGKKRWFRPTPVVIGQPYHPQTADKRATPEEYKAIADDLMERIFALARQVKE